MPGADIADDFDGTRERHHWSGEGGRQAGARLRRVVHEPRQLDPRAPFGHRTKVGVGGVQRRKQRMGDDDVLHAGSLSGGDQHKTFGGGGMAGGLVDDHTADDTFGLGAGRRREEQTKCECGSACQNPAEDGRARADKGGGADWRERGEVEYESWSNFFITFTGWSQGGAEEARGAGW